MNNELRLIKWANDHFPPIDLSNEAPAVLELIKAYQLQKVLIGELIDALDSVKIIHLNNESNYPEGTIGYNLNRKIKDAIIKANNHLK